jgi:hypothetical protein
METGKREFQRLVPLTSQVRQKRRKRLDKTKEKEQARRWHGSKQKFAAFLRVIARN